jgi:three-Cys-motif partner protein
LTASPVREICRVRESDPPYFAWGSPLLALRTVPPFEHCTFVELNGRSVQSLKARTTEFGDRAKVHPGDVNRLAASIIESDVPGGAPCFCLLDQQGGELEWNTVDRIASIPRRRGKPELMILFPLRMSLLRLLSVGDAITVQSAARWDSTLGNHDWFAVYQARLAGDIDPTEAQRRYLALYVAGLKRIGYKHVTSSVISAPRSPGLKRQEMYHLLFATDNDTGFRIMSDVMKRPYSLDMPVSRQPTLFE